MSINQKFQIKWTLVLNALKRIQDLPDDCGSSINNGALLTPFF